MLRGVADPLHSSFRLSYNMLLNLTKIEGGEATYLIHRSFLQFSDSLQTPKLKTDIATLTEESNGIEIKEEALASTYHQLLTERNIMEERLMEFTHEPDVLLPFLNPGRVVHVVDGNRVFGWGIILNFHQMSKANQRKMRDAGVSLDVGDHWVDVLLPTQPTGLVPYDRPEPFDPSSSGDPDIQIVPCMLKNLNRISALRVNDYP